MTHLQGLTTGSFWSRRFTKWDLMIHRAQLQFRLVISCYPGEFNVGRRCFGGNFCHVSMVVWNDATLRLSNDGFFEFFEYLKLVFSLISHIFRSLCFLISPFSQAWFPLSLRRYSLFVLGFR